MPSGTRRQTIECSEENCNVSSVDKIPFLTQNIHMVSASVPPCLAPKELQVTTDRVAAARCLVPTIPRACDTERR
ncbi:hypothetical protein PGTUg99_020600 [Puccinia graminis f. sp. tritici]|uniref:Uncharacterized protein n=1 Tax=Puccinia graminis f. sp. tritici TaxID=56615 RepID=A0A5B0NKR5_PUCGR|nr:hypothetical protein PGTUg99_020600 [Puccinia graminis f. sp. tritici]